jgi:RHS repeat-associated protein
MPKSSTDRTNSYRYTARQLDPETGLYYYRARYYDPSIGRFLSEDPIGFAGGINFYAYVSNQPTRYTDPFGLVDMLFHPVEIRSQTWIDDLFGAETRPSGQMEFICVCVKGGYKAAITFSFSFVMNTGWLARSHENKHVAAFTNFMRSRTSPYERLEKVFSTQAQCETYIRSAKGVVANQFMIDVLRGDEVHKQIDRWEPRWFE